MTWKPPSLGSLARGLALSEPLDQARCRERAERALDGMRVAEVHAEAERLTGRTFPLQRQARAAIADAWLIAARDFQRWTRGAP